MQTKDQQECDHFQVHQWEEIPAAKCHHILGKQRSTIRDETVKSSLISTTPQVRLARNAQDPLDNHFDYTHAAEPIQSVQLVNS